MESLLFIEITESYGEYKNIQKYSLSSRSLELGRHSMAQCTKLYAV